MIVTGIVVLLASWAKWGRLKTKIKAVREFVVLLDEALYDDRVTEEEWQQLWEKFKKILEAD